ncbi:MAG: SAM-dependent methyltransferase [Oscillospiraceae bacterium]
MKERYEAMDLSKNGELIRSLRKEKGLTQKQVAEILGVQPKTVSKWETGHGYPDTSLLNDLAKALGVNTETLLSGSISPNKENIENYKRVKFYICPHCGSFLHGTGEASVSCCGKTLSPLKASSLNDRHGITVNETPNEYTVSISHEMNREHHIAFISYISNDTIMTVKLSPEQDSSASFPKLQNGVFYFYCTDHGLFEYDTRSKAEENTDKSSLTALISAFSRAYLNKHGSSAVFRDTYAEKLFSEEEFRQIEGFVSKDHGNISDYISTYLAPTPLGRGKFCEETLETACLTGTCQYVILGCGYDTFAFRSKNKKLRIFEIDKQAVISDKLGRINRAGLEIPENVRYISADLSRSDLGEILEKSGFDRRKKTLFSCLGLMYYITDDEISRLFESIAGIASNGSTVVFDFPDSHLFSSNMPRVKEMLKMAEFSGEPMRSCFGYSELEKLLEEHGFLLYELLNREEIQQRFFEGSEMTAFENVNYAQAVLSKR